MKKRKKFIICLSAIFINIILLVSFLIFRDATSLNNLNKEIDILSKLDVMTDNYDRKIRSSGGYATVERSVKKYFGSFSSDIDEITDLVNNEEFTSILSYDNYKSDGPEFTKSFEYLESSKNTFNDKIDDMIGHIDSEYINNYINEKSANSYYISLYHGIMNDERFSTQLHQLKDLLKKTKVRVNKTYDVSYDVLNFLKVYKEDWELEDGQIKFKTDELYNYYNNLISKIDKKDE